VHPHKQKSRHKKPSKLLIFVGYLIIIIIQLKLETELKPVFIETYSMKFIW